MALVSAFEQVHNHAISLLSVVLSLMCLFMQIMLVVCFAHEYLHFHAYFMLVLVPCHDMPGSELIKPVEMP